MLPPGETWGLPTHHDVLIRDYAMGVGVNPTVTCACGRRVLADVCVDITALPLPIRAALGMQGVEYLCDACCAVLYVHRYLGESAMCALLGAPAAHIAAAQERDQTHDIGMRSRCPRDQAQHALIDATPFIAAMGSLTLNAVLPTTVTGGAVVPHMTRTLTHADSARALGLILLPVLPPPTLPSPTSKP